MTPPLNITPGLASKLISDQFPEYAHLPITSVEKQGHDNRTFQLGENMLIKIPTAEAYALKVTMELDSGTWLRAKAWALWKATYELCQIQDKNSYEASTQKRIIDDVLK